MSPRERNFMIYTVIGIRRNIKIKDTEDQRGFDGLTLYVTSPDPDVDGLFPDKISVRTDSQLFPLAVNLKPPVDVDCQFNRRGRLQSMELA